MRLKIFNLPKNRQFSFHTRYYNEKPLATEDTAKVERGSFSKFKRKYANFEKPGENLEPENKVKAKVNLPLLLTLIALAVASYFFVPKYGFLISVCVLAFTLAFVNKK